MLCDVLVVVCSVSTAQSPAGSAAEAGTFSDFQETAELDLWVFAVNFYE